MRIGNPNTKLDDLGNDIAKSLNALIESYKANNPGHEVSSIKIEMIDVSKASNIDPDRQYPRRASIVPWESR